MLNFVLFSYINQIIFFGCAWCRSDINFHSLHKRNFIVLGKSSLKHLWNKNSWESSSCCCILVSSVQFSSQSYLILCNPMDCSMPGFPVHQQRPEFAQTHVHRVGDAIQSSHPLSSPTPAINLSHHQGLFQGSVFVSGGQGIQASASASVFPVSIQVWFPLGFTGLISLQSKGLLRIFSNTTTQKHQFFSIQLSL